MSASASTSKAASPDEMDKRASHENSSSGEFPLSNAPHLLLSVLTNYGLGPQSLAKLEATCKYFRSPALCYPDHDLPFSEVAAYDICNKRMTFRSMTIKERDYLKKKCGGSWKMVLRFFLAAEMRTGRGKTLAIAGPGHSIVVKKNGDVYSFGSNRNGELGNGTVEDAAPPRLIRSLQGIRIIQAAASFGRTIFVSEEGRVYTCGKQASGNLEPAAGVANVSTPKLVESLKDIFVVQAAFGMYYTAFLSNQGVVYTVSWGKESRLIHDTEWDFEPRPLLGALENVPIVQIAAGYCCLLVLAFQPSGMSVYSVGCGLGGKLGHGDTKHDGQPRLIEGFQALNFQPIKIAAGSFHCVAVGADGRVCTWGWGYHGCLGHGNYECQYSPKVVTALTNVKAVNITAGYYTTFVLSDDGRLFTFGYGSSALGHATADVPADVPQEQQLLPDVLTPELVTSVAKLNESIVDITVTNSIHWTAHTFLLAESGKLYAFGTGDSGQLGFMFDPRFIGRCSPQLVNIDLS